MANVGPADYNYDESISSLRYANRAKNIKNKAKINEDPKDALLRQFQKEIDELKKQLEDGRVVLIVLYESLLELYPDVVNVFYWHRHVAFIWLILIDVLIWAFITLPEYSLAIAVFDNSTD